MTHSTSAEFGQAWAVEITYHTDFDGRVIDPAKEDHPRTLHGMFDTIEEANAWIYAYPDGDTDVEDMVPVVTNRVRPKTDDLFVALFTAVAACEAPEGTQVDDVLAQYQAHFDRITGHNADESREHRHNPAPYCAKCGGPCEMQNDG